MIGVGAGLAVAAVLLCVEVVLRQVRGRPMGADGDDWATEVIAFAVLAVATTGVAAALITA